MKRKKIIFSAAVLALACAVLAGCGNSASSSSAAASSEAVSSAPASSAAESASVESTVSAEINGSGLDDAVDTLLEANPISNQFELTAMNIEYDFNISADDVVSYKGVRSNDNGDAGLVLVIQPAEGKADEICKTLETYKEDQVAFYGNYAEFAQAQKNVEDAVILGNDDMVIMVIASNESSGDLNAAVKSVLGN